ncbi:hypothetical protein C484_17471 [Natrialba taiwanensis DSM 12281]|uniref:Uncharacterized protein n=1 Tax=Natrialba taiwanensis DSM 12281 TaxID=1230458 RepID=L9ZPT6_9EURY|nr:hypothetical protein C484_17471 [Natrialba taiwanensis DSM 12281]
MTRRSPLSVLGVGIERLFVPGRPGTVPSSRCAVVSDRGKHRVARVRCVAVLDIRSLNSLLERETCLVSVG